MSDEVIVITRSKAKAAPLLALAAVFVVGGIAMIRSGNSDGWWLTILFGIGLLVGIYQLTPNSIRLQIDRHGIEMKTIFGTTKMAWADVDGFYVGRIRTRTVSHTVIAIKYSSSCQTFPMGRKVSAAVAGVEGALPDAFVLSAEKLCNVLNDAKRKWGNAQPLVAADGPASSATPRRLTRS